MTTFKKFICGLALALAAALGATAVNPAPASAYPGCSSLVRNQVDTWNYTVLYNYSVGVTEPPTAVGDVHLRARLGYLYCPNGDGMNKIAPAWLQFCWMNPSEKTRFDGVTFNGVVYDDAVTGWNPGPIKAKSTHHQEGNCVTQAISSDHWMQLRHGPEWQVVAVVNVQLALDTEWEFHHNGHKEKPIHVNRASEVGPWHTRTAH